VITIRVLNGTPPDVRLCDTCRWSQIEKDATGHEDIFCGYRPGQNSHVTRKIVECNGYANKLQKTEKELEKIAWILDVKGKTIIGFKPPDKFRKDNE
jgi:hypothetical protein